ncbi:MAG: GNAT family N-acetyltransferase [Pseudonocardiaceae bacterium]
MGPRLRPRHARTIIDFGFTTLGLHRISAAIGPDNAASIAIVNRLGFTEKGGHP